jgi:hypothetical protein
MAIRKRQRLEMDVKRCILICDCLEDLVLLAWFGLVWGEAKNMYSAILEFVVIAM